MRGPSLPTGNDGIIPKCHTCRSIIWVEDLPASAVFQDPKWSMKLKCRQ
jgi:hypothetical protein